MEAEYTSEEVGRHKDETELWMTIHGHVYDLSKFLKEHPGGEEVLLNLAGRDGTTCFDEIGHSQEAIQLRDTFRIGRVVGNFNGSSERPGESSPPLPLPTTSIDTSNDDDDHREYEESQKKASSHLPIFIAIAVLLYALVVYYVFFS